MGRIWGINMKIVINKCYGGFGLSYKAVMRYAELSGFTLYASVEKSIGDYGHLIPYNERNKDPFIIYYHTKPLKNETYPEESDFYERDIKRDDLNLVKVVEELGNEAGGRFSRLRIVEIPDGVDYEIEEYDGMEWIAEKHRTWH
jgi:hypothetical protein